MTHHPRKQIMIDQTVQGTLIARVVLYWFLCLGSVVLYAWCSMVWMEPEGAEPIWRRLSRLMPALLGSLSVLPLAIADVIRASNRFVGPIHHLRNAFKRLVIGDAVRPMELRSSDHWNDLVLRFNQLLPRLQSTSTRERDLAGIADASDLSDPDCLTADHGREAFDSSGASRDSS